MPIPFVSVIIPVYNSSKLLEKCLKALEAQSYPFDYFEIIVVDNNSTEDIRLVVAQFHHAKYSFESSPGSYAARNQGISIAKGEVIAFTDSDCIPNQIWLAQGVEKLLEVSQCGLAAGEIEFFCQNPEQPSLVEIYDLKSCLKQKAYLEKENFGATANVFTFKDVLDRVGVFNSDLKSGGDKEWGRRVFSYGYKQAYANKAIVRHPARYQREEMRKKILRVTEGLYKQEKNKQTVKEIFKHLKPSRKKTMAIIQDEQIKGLLPKILYFLLDLSFEHTKAYKKLQLLVQSALNSGKTNLS